LNPESSQTVIRADTDAVVLRQAAECPNDFIMVTAIKVWGKTKKEATKRFDDRLKALLPALEAAANCSQYVCDEGDCEFDYIVDNDEPRKIFKKSAKGKKRRRWIVNADVFFGCFCPDQGDDKENDPEGQDF
jgi:hypothetical protein